MQGPRSAPLHSWEHSVAPFRVGVAWHVIVRVPPHFYEETTQLPVSQLLSQHVAARAEREVRDGSETVEASRPRLTWDKTFF